MFSRDRQPVPIIPPLQIQSSAFIGPGDEELSDALSESIDIASSIESGNEEQLPPQHLQYELKIISSHLLTTSDKPLTDIELSAHSSEYFVGRNPGCFNEIQIPQGSVSKVHARLEYCNRKWNVTNLTETSSLTVAGKLIEPRETTVLPIDGLIQFGRMLCSLSNGLNLSEEDIKKWLTDEFHALMFFARVGIITNSLKCPNCGRETPSVRGNSTNGWVYRVCFEIFSHLKSFCIFFL
jgi:hypothetical protein